MQTTSGSSLRGWPGPLPAQDARSAYGHFVRLLLTALSRLAATGSVVPPDEGMDLIHDFFVQAWPGLERHYDAGRASFDTYVFGSFLRFARPRIARLNRLRSALATPGEVAALAANDVDPEDHGQPHPDVAGLRRAMDGLTPVDRALLSRYLGHDEPSERALAAGFGMSRHEVRTRLADALGTVAALLGASDGFAEPDSSACRLLWLEHHTPREAAGLLHLPVSEIQAARRRILARLVRATKGQRSMSNAFTRPPAIDSDALREFVRRSLEPESTADDLRTIERYRSEIQVLFAESDADVVVGPLDGHPAERIAAFYAALAGDPSPDGESDSAERDALLKARMDDDQAVGAAFAQVLLADLPAGMRDFDTIFAGCLPAEQALREELGHHPSVDAADGAGDGLLRFGMTPSTVARAIRALRNNARRQLRQAGLVVGAYGPMDGTGDAETSAGILALSGDAALRDLEWSTRLPRDTAARLYAWLLKIAAYKPAIFEGFWAQADGNGVRLRWIGDKQPDLFRRWSSDQPDAAERAPQRRG